MSPSKVSTLDFTTFHNIIDGKQRGGSTQTNGVDPSTQEKLWDVPVATQQDVDDAVIAAQKAFKTWGRTSIDERKDLMKQFLSLWKEHEADFTKLLQKESGKPKRAAAIEVGAVGYWLMQHISVNIPEERIEDHEKIITTRYTPLGVVGAICPWNFPLILSIGKISPSLLTGCCIIVKPSPFTPYTALKMIELMQEVFPAGVVQALGGDDKLGPMLTNHPGIAKITFTGSIATGKKVMEACSKSLKRVTLELGGNDASIILPDVDIEQTAAEVAMGAFQNSGQVCVATKRVYVHESIHRPFVDAMIKATKAMKVGSPDEEGVVLGPVQNSMQYEKIKEFFADSKKNGYKFAVGEPDIQSSKGYFIQPTIIENPPNESKIVQEEPFGPIVPVLTWSDEEEVIQRANNTNTGLGACVWGKDIKHAEEIGMRLEAGNVFINSYEKPTPAAFFSGHKESGIGGEWGTNGYMSFCNAHVMHSYKAKI